MKADYFNKICHMITLKEKRSIIKKVRRADNCIVICFNKEDFDFGVAGDSKMNADFFKDVQIYTKKWCRRWPHFTPEKEDETD